MSDGITNLFVHRSAARRYAVARPFFHPLVVARIASFIGKSHFDRALDVGCGTGQSARALADLALSVDAVDISREMLAEAEPHERITYHISPAEQLPFEDASFDVATVGLAFHWFDQPTFLREVFRVLRSTGWLIVYNSGFTGEMAENHAFRLWSMTVYHKRFPTPPRRSIGVTDELVGSCGFELCGDEEFGHDEVMSAAQLTGYLLTQTNVIAATDSGAMPIGDAEAWIANGIGSFFGGRPKTMKFVCRVWYLRRNQ